MSRWAAYEADWLLHPTADDLAASYFEYKPPAGLRGPEPPPEPPCFGVLAERPGRMH